MKLESEITLHSNPTQIKPKPTGQTESLESKIFGGGEEMKPDSQTITIGVPHC